MRRDGKAEKGIECKKLSKGAEGQFHLSICKRRRAETTATDTGSKEGRKNSVSVKVPCYQASPAVLWGDSAKGGTAGGRTWQRLGTS